MTAFVFFFGIQLAHAAATEQECIDMYPLPDREINFVSENTGHDPRAFLIRRCISKIRKQRANERAGQRRQARAAAHFDASAAKATLRRKKTEDYIQGAVRRQILKKSRFRSSTHTLDRASFYKARYSRRSLVRETEGLDRINAIRRRLMKDKAIDLCTTVKAIRKFNNPCRDR